MCYTIIYNSITHLTVEIKRLQKNKSLGLVVNFYNPPQTFDALNEKTRITFFQEDKIQADLLSCIPTRYRAYIGQKRPVG